MIYEGSCNPEDWSNDAENLALITGINQIIIIIYNIIVFTYFFCIYICCLPCKL